MSQLHRATSPTWIRAHTLITRLFHLVSCINFLSSCRNGCMPCGWVGNFHTRIAFKAKQKAERVQSTVVYHQHTGPGPFYSISSLLFTTVKMWLKVHTWFNRRIFLTHCTYKSVRMMCAGLVIKQKENALLKCGSGGLFINPLAAVWCASAGAPAADAVRFS